MAPHSRHRRPWSTHLPSPYAHRRGRCHALPPPSLPPSRSSTTVRRRHPWSSTYHLPMACHHFFRPWAAKSARCASRASSAGAEAVVFESGARTRLPLGSSPSSPLSPTKLCLPHASISSELLPFLPTITDETLPAPHLDLQASKEEIARFPPEENGSSTYDTTCSAFIHILYILVGIHTRRRSLIQDDELRQIVYWLHCSIYICTLLICTWKVACYHEKLQTQCNEACAVLHKSVDLSLLLPSIFHCFLT